MMMIDDEPSNDVASTDAPTSQPKRATTQRRSQPKSKKSPTEEKPAKATRQRKPVTETVNAAATEPTTEPVTKPDDVKVPPAPAYPEPETVGGHEPTGKSRKRRHNRHRKGDSADSSDERAASSRSHVDPDELFRCAWKIFKGEVVEEGLALMDDRVTSETARRAFRVAEIFLTEAALHRPKQEDNPS